MHVGCRGPELRSGPEEPLDLRDLAPVGNKQDQVVFRLDHGVVMNERVDRFRKADQWLELRVAGLFVITDGQISLWRDYFDKESMFAAMAALG